MCIRDRDKQGGLVEANIFGTSCEYRLQLRGEHWALNSVAAAATAVVAGASLSVATEGISLQEPISGRGNIHQCNSPKGEFTLIDETYNASPISMKAAIRALQEFKLKGRGRRIVVLGDMLELGSKASELHESLSVEIIRNDVNRVFTVGDLMANLYNTLPENIQGFHTSYSSEMTQILKETIDANDVVLIKGSNGSKMKLLVDALLGPLSESGAN